MVFKTYIKVIHQSKIKEQKIHHLLVFSAGEVESTDKKLGDDLS